MVEPVETTVFISPFLWSFRQAQRSPQRGFYLKKHLKIISKGYLILKFVVKKYGLMKIDFPACGYFDASTSSTTTSSTTALLFAELFGG